MSGTKKSSSVYDLFSIRDDEIRLLRLSPGQWSDPVSVTFSKAKLSDKPIYYALSYVWGDPLDTVSILAHGCECQVTRNLHAALRRVRAHADQNQMILWIDAICINQVDLAEKSHQITFMGHIYSQCKECLIWMGEIPYPPSGVAGMPRSEDNACLDCHAFNGDSDDFDTKWDSYLSSFSFKEPNRSNLFSIEDIKDELWAGDIALHSAWFLRLVASGHHFTDVPPFSSPRFEKSKYFTSMFHAFVFLERNTWFQRLWVVQEAVLPATVRILFGSVSIPLTVFIQAMRTFQTHTPRGCCISSGHMHYALRLCIRNFLENFIPIYSLRDARKSPPTHIFDLCLQFVERQSTVDLDRVFSLLGLVNVTEAHSITVDYTVSPALLYSQVCSNYIETTSSLLPLSLAGHGSRLPDSPSWSVDWPSLNHDGHWTWRRLFPRFEASGDMTQVPRIDFNLHLSLVGGHVDTITQVAEPISSDLGDVWTGARDIQSWHNLLYSASNTNRSYPTGKDSWAEVWWRSICADCCWGANTARRLTKRDVGFFSARLAGKGSILVPTKLSPQKSESEAPTSDSDEHQPPLSDAHFSDIEDMAMSVILQRRLFLSESGFMGLTSGEARHGDRILVLPGCKTPLILRPLVAESAGLGPNTRERTPATPQFEVVGSCYVHGIMDGQATQMNSFKLRPVILV